MNTLTQLINEKIEKIDPSKILTDLTNNTDVGIIDSFVNSKKKDDRIAIAANPNLTKEQQTKLANDRTNGVKQALCYNANLDIDLAKQLLDEEPLRVDYIAEYGRSHLDNLVLDILEKNNETFKVYNVLSRFFKSPEISDDAIKRIIEKFPNSLTGTEGRPLYSKPLSKKAVFLLLDYLSKPQIKFGDGTLSRLIVKQEKHIKESDIKKLDWKNNPNVQQSVVGRTDLSEQFTLDIITHLREDTSISIMSVINVNPHMTQSVSVLNALMKKLITFKLSYNHSFDFFEPAIDLPLDPRLMVDLVKHMQSEKYETYTRFILNNKFFPSYGLDELEINIKNFKRFITSPASDETRIEKLIKKFVNNSKTAEEAIWGLAERKTEPAHISYETAQYLLKFGFISLWLEHVVVGELVDEVLDNLDEYSKFYSGEKGSQYSVKSQQPKFSVLSSLAKNTKLKTIQQRRILDIFNNLNPDEKPNYGGIARQLSISDKNIDPDFFEELMNEPDASIWDVWDGMGNGYFQYSKKVIKLIDRIVLNTSDAPVSILKQHGNINFNDWFNNNNRKWGTFDNGGMSRETGIKYLIHFITTGSDGIKKILLNGWITDEWITPEIGMILYNETQDVKYLPKDAQDIFLF